MSPGPRVEEIPNHEPSAWLRGRVDRLARRLIAGEVDHCCEHLALPMVVVLWRPDCVVCAACRAVVATVPDDPEDKTCDRCRQRVAGVTLGFLETPGIVVVFGLCEDCRRREVAAA